MKEYLNRRLGTLLFDFMPLQVIGTMEKEVEGLALDSRLLRGGEVFFALKGTQVDGHRFIPEAVEAGAAAIVCEELPEQLDERVTYIQVDNAARALGLMASTYYAYPSRALKLVGITGTNGKTSTATLAYQAVSALGYKAGLISTVENRIGSKVLPATHTTPNAIELQALLFEMVQAGCDFAFMEVSSHALAQRRLEGTHFTGAVFTNLSHDHLDYHGSFKAYMQAKQRLFTSLDHSAFALFNADDKHSWTIKYSTRAWTYRYSLQRIEDMTFKGKVASFDLAGMELLIDGYPFYTPLLGTYNAYNILAAYGMLLLLRFKREDVLRALSAVQGAPGRLQKVQVEGSSVLGIVDYAHTPDALENVLDTLRSCLKGGEHLITVVGAGGDRDKAKRPRMAAIAARLSDRLILTSDNPRTEKPESILEDMQAGLSADKMRKTLVIVDRRQAIRAACRLAGEKDVILLAGKGHEKYQEIQGVKHPFDDVEELKQALAESKEQTIKR